MIFRLTLAGARARNYFVNVSLFLFFFHLWLSSWLKDSRMQPEPEANNSTPTQTSSLIYLFVAVGSFACNSCRPTFPPSTTLSPNPSEMYSHSFDLSVFFVLFSFFQQEIF